MTNGAIEADEAAIEEVLAAEEQRCQAVRESDRATLDLLLGEEFINTHSSGSSEDRTSHLNRLTTPGSDTYTREHLTVRLYGDVAVMRGDMDVHHSAAPPTLLQALQVWIRRDGRWQLVALQNAPRQSRN